MLGFSITSIICLTVAGIFALMLNSCQDARTQYYQAQQSCVQNGGSWVPQNNSSENYNAFCLRLK